MMKMKNSTRRRLAVTARELMLENPISVNHHAEVLGAARFLTSLRISSVPVIDDAGRPVGELSWVDNIRSLGGATERKMIGESIGKAIDATGHASIRALTAGIVITPVLASVDLDATVEQVMATMLARNVHHVFVLDEDGVLAGVITIFDVLRRLMPSRTADLSSRRFTYD